MANLSDTDYECKDFSDIAKCFRQLHVFINQEVETLKSQQKALEDRMEVVENQTQFANAEFHDIHNKYIPDLEAKLENEATERLKLELWGRKWNVIIRGVKGAPVKWETPKVTEALVRQFLRDVLKIEERRSTSMLFTAVHRLPSGEADKRNVILRLSSLIDKEDVLSAATKLPAGSGFSVVPDLPPLLATRRVELLRRRRDMSPATRKNTRLVYMHEPPFIALRTR